MTPRWVACRKQHLSLTHTKQLEACFSLWIIMQRMNVATPQTDRYWFERMWNTTGESIHIQPLKVEDKQGSIRSKFFSSLGSVQGACSEGEHKGFQFRPAHLQPYPSICTLPPSHTKALENHWACEQACWAQFQQASSFLLCKIWQTYCSKKRSSGLSSQASPAAYALALH